MLKEMRCPAKYTQGKGALASFYAQAKDLGERFLFVCSNSGHACCKDELEKSFEGSDAYRRYEIFGGISSNAEIARMEEIIKEDNIDCVVALGGGSAIDTAKAAAFYTGKKIAIIPTVAATDAPCTGLSVIYNEDETFDRYVFYPSNPDLVLVDTQVIADAPVDYFVAGLGDALGTYFEARTCKKMEAPSLEGGGICNSAMALCELCCETLFKYGAMAKHAVEANVVTPALETVVEATIYLSGVGADNGGLAAAHSIYNGFTAIDECADINHGDLVAFGTLVQLVLENASEDEILEVMSFIHEVGLPMCLGDLNIDDPSKIMPGCIKACAEGETIHNLASKPSAEDVYAAALQVDAMGRDYLGLNN